MTRHFTLSILTTAAAILTVTAAAPRALADERIDISGFAGIHVFSDNNELGQIDIDIADSPVNSLLFGVRVGYALSWLISAEGELGIMPTEGRDSDSDVVVFGWRAHGLVHFTRPESRFRPFVVFGGGALTSSSTDESLFQNDTDGLLHTGGGIKAGVQNNWGIRADARILFPPSSGSEFATTDFEVLLSLYKTFPPKPSAQPKDSDGDGIVDGDDKCPEQAEDKDGFQDDDGCPDNDNDEDGIADADDKCPNEPESRNGIDDHDGCPETDEDRDGIVGSKDKCPNSAEDADGFEDEDGCPETDNDGDGILDADDQCPDDPETQNGFEDEDGCPDVVPAAIKQFTGTIEGIAFKKNSDIILASSNATLDAAAKVLSEYPKLRLEIQGHTDSDGTDEYNKDLSQRRADAVKAYLVDKGIDEARLVATGFGESRPVAANDTPENKAKNRRVDFVLINEAADKE